MICNTSICSNGGAVTQTENDSRQNKQTEKLEDAQVKKHFLYAHLCSNTVGWHLQIPQGALYANIPPESREAPEGPAYIIQKEKNERNRLLRP